MVSVLVSVALFYTTTNTHLWDLPGDDLAAPASALCGWKGVNSLSLLFLYNTLLQQLFRVHVSMRQFLWQHDMLQLVRFVSECLDSFAAAQ